MASAFNRRVMQLIRLDASRRKKMLGCVSLQRVWVGLVNLMDKYYKDAVEREWLRAK